MNLSSDICGIVAKIFVGLSNKKYVALRYFGIDYLEPGNDIDILCKNKESVLTSILSTLKKNITHSYKISITKRDHIHIDIIKDKSIYLRFDLIDSFKHFKKFSVGDFYVGKIFNRRWKSKYTFNNMTYQVSQPNEEDELVLRYLEFIENFDKRPEKLRHYEYLYHKILDKPESASYLKILGQILEPRSISIKEGSRYRSNFIYLIQLLLRKLHNFIGRLNKL